MADGILLLTNMLRTGSMKHGWVVILGSSVRTGIESGANVRRRHDSAQVFIVTVVDGGEF